MPKTSGEVAALCFLAWRFVAAAVGQTSWRTEPTLGDFYGTWAVYDVSRDALVVPSLGRNGIAAWTWRSGGWEPQVGLTPPSRSFPTVCYDAARTQLLLFGGELSDSLTHSYVAFNDLWRLDANGWQQVITANSPSVRSSAAMAVDPATGDVILHGGYAGSFFGTPVVLGDTWRFRGANWLPAGSGPAMQLHTMASGPATGVVLFGGYTTPETWVWSAGVWRRPTPAHSPPGRFFHSMTYDTTANRVVVFGGAGPQGMLADYWEWDGLDWTQPVHTNPMPPRTFMGLVCDQARGRMLLAGGQTSDGPQGDIWELRAGNWTRLRGRTAPPVERAAAVAWDPVRQRTLLFGGGDVGGRALDTQWDWEGRFWTETTPSVRPPARIGAAVATDDSRGRIVLFGGMTSGQMLGDHWEWDGFNWRSLQPPLRPSARFGAGMAYDSLRRRVVLFGGATGTAPTAALGDTWQWDGAAWTQLQPTVSPLPRHTMAMAFDARRGVVVLFGGWVSAPASDTWEWNGSAWTSRLPPQLPPTPNTDPYMAFDRHRQRCVLFDRVNSVTQTWEWDGATWSRLLTATNPPRPVGSPVYDPVQKRLVLPATLSRNVEYWHHGAIDAAETASFATACAGGAGVPELAIEGGAQPWLGDLLTARVTPILPGAAALLWLGASDAAWNGQALPLLLDPFGMPGCVMAASFDDPSRLAVADAQGVAGFPLSVPNAVALVGLQVFAQAGAVDATANAAGFVVTNGLRLRLGAR